MSKEFENNNMNKESGNFGLPEGYFQKSATDILNKIEWHDEHKAFPQLLLHKKESGFIVPDHYFEKLESKLELTEYPQLLKHKQTRAGFIAPANYFNDAELSILEKLISEKENELAGYKNLSCLNKQNAFAIHENYFDNSEVKLHSVIQPKTKVISLFNLKIWYAAAAAVFILTLSLWLYKQYFTINVEKDCGTLACVDKKDLIKAKNLENIENDELYEIVDTKKLEESLDNKSENNTDTDSSLNNLDNNELLDEL